MHFHPLTTGKLIILCFVHLLEKSHRGNFQSHNSLLCQRQEEKHKKQKNRKTKKKNAKTENREQENRKVNANSCSFEVRKEELVLAYWGFWLFSLPGDRLCRDRRLQHYASVSFAFGIFRSASLPNLCRELFSWRWTERTFNLYYVWWNWMTEVNHWKCPSIVLLHFVMISGHDIIVLVQEKARNNPNGCSSEPRHAAARPKTVRPISFSFFFLFFFFPFLVSLFDLLPWPFFHSGQISNYFSLLRFF